MLPFYLSPQQPPPFIGTPDLLVELLDRDRDESRRGVEFVNAATAVANAVSEDAAAACRREHEELARDLGLARPPIGFGRS